MVRVGLPGERASEEFSRTPEAESRIKHSKAQAKNATKGINLEGWGKEEEEPVRNT